MLALEFYASHLAEVQQFHAMSWIVWRVRPFVGRENVWYRRVHRVLLATRSCCVRSDRRFFPRD